MTRAKAEQASKRETLAARPGWARLRRAGAELHAAEVLLGDPVAASSTAVVHLRAFWTEVHAAGREAGVGEVDADTPVAWLEHPITGLDKGTRERMRRELAGFEQVIEDQRSARKRWNLRYQALAARELYEALVPVIGGVPLRRRRLRRLWGAVGLVILFGPLAGYYALNRKVEGEGPWRATYFTDRELEKELTVLREGEADHDWGKGPPLEAVPPDKFSVRWETCLNIDELTQLVLQVNANDGARVFVDGETVIDAWDKDPKTRKRGAGSGTIALEPGEHHLSIEYFESMGDANIKLTASFGDEIPAALPRERLRYPGDRPDEADPCARGGE